MAVYDQAAYRIGNDDGSESAYTFAASENTGINPTLSADANYILRIAVTDAITGGAGTDDWQLQVQKGSGGYSNVTTGSTYAKAYNSTNLTDGGATTARLTTVDTLIYNTFIAGLVSEDGLADNLGLTANAYTEFVFPITLVNADLANGDVITFRIVCNGSTLNSYTQSPTFTIIKSVSTSMAGAFPPIVVPVVAPVTAPAPTKSSKIRITDRTGRLPSNPKHWPEGLKRAIAECCCGESSSTSSSTSSSDIPLDTGVCGCTTIQTSGWTKPLVASVVSSKLGSFTVPLSATGPSKPVGVNAEYTGILELGPQKFVKSFNCTGPPNGFGFFTFWTRRVYVRLQCVDCPSAPQGKLWLGFTQVSGIVSSLGVQHYTGRILHLLSCDPILFAQLASTTATCGQPLTNCCTGGAATGGLGDGFGAYNLCGDSTSTFDAVGHTLTLDISE